MRRRFFVMNSSVLTYTSIFQSKLSINPLAFNTSIKSHTYDEVGLIKFNGALSEIISNIFNNGDSLSTCILPTKVTKIGDQAFNGCTHLTSITIPDSVTEIGDWAFCYCYSLTRVTIPDSVTTIGGYAFYDCKSLKTVYCKPTTPPTGGEYMFGGNVSDHKIYVPYQSLDAYKAAEYWSEYADDIVGYDFEKVYPFPVTLEYGLLYPEVTQYLIDKYGLNYGTKVNPLPIEETIMLGDSYANSTGSGVVKYISTSDTWDSSVSLRLYLEDHRNTYYCAALNTGDDFGRAGRYFYD